MVLAAAGAVLVVGVVVEALLEVAALVVGVVDVVLLVAVLLVAVLLVVVVLDAVLVTVVVRVVVVCAGDVVVELAFLFELAEPPKNVDGWPLPVIECPAMRSGTV